MKFIPGQPRHPDAGRKPGSPNKTTLEFKEVLVKHCFNAAEALLELYNDARERIQDAAPEAQPIYLKIAADLAKDIADRVYPRIKSIEHKQSNQYDGITPLQKAEIMENAARLIREQHAGSGQPVIRDCSSDDQSDKPGSDIRPEVSTTD